MGQVRSAQGYVVLANAAAGKGQREAIEAAVAVLRQGGLVELRWAGELEELDAVLAGLDGRALVVAGGDGSLHTAVNRLHRSGLLGRVSVGLLPLGTGNDLARGLGLPLGHADAASAILAGEPRRLDLIEDDTGTVAVNAAHAGLGAEAAARAAGLKRALGPLAYPAGALLAGLREAGWRLAVAVDGVPLTGPGERLLMVGVANGPTIGGGTPLCPPAACDDGLLDVVVVPATTVAARAAFGRALRQGRHLDLPGVRHQPGTAVTISGDPARHNVDGELSQPVTARRYRVLPGAWSLIMPPQGAPHPG